MFDLDRFVKAQDPVMVTVLRELRAGRKETHWMWFVFPQLRGLGRSTVAQHYGIENLAEARAYLGHAILAPRLKECVEAVLGGSGKTLHEIFGSPDDVKFCSSMTLFALASGSDKPFREALVRYCEGREDAATLDLLGIHPSR
jgi:uncharacterized protein (DUF1810 family)